jgi:hypothetical protein
MRQVAQSTGTLKKSPPMYANPSELLKNSCLLSDNGHVLLNTDEFLPLLLTRDHTKRRAGCWGPALFLFLRQREIDRLCITQTRLRRIRTQFDRGVKTMTRGGISENGAAHDM